MSFSDENVACTRNASIDEASSVTEQLLFIEKYMNRKRYIYQNILYLFYTYIGYFEIPVTFYLKSHIVCVSVYTSTHTPQIHTYFKSLLL